MTIYKHFYSLSQLLLDVIVIREASAGCLRHNWVFSALRGSVSLRQSGSRLYFRFARLFLNFYLIYSFFFTTFSVFLWFFSHCLQRWRIFWFYFFGAAKIYFFIYLIYIFNRFIGFRIIFRKFVKYIMNFRIYITNIFFTIPQLIPLSKLGAVRPFLSVGQVDPINKRKLSNWLFSSFLFFSLERN